MRLGLLLLIILSLGLMPRPAAAADENNCFNCHMDIEDESGPAHLISLDIHYQKGLGCVGCHGGDETLDDMDDVRKVRSYRGVPKHRQVPEFCSRCHSDAAYMRNHNPALPTDQLDKYKTSVHGKQLFTKNDQKVANCISCHSVHDIGDAKLPHSSTYPSNIPAMCGRCHSDAQYMAEYKILTNQVEEYSQSVHGVALLERGDLGAPACNDCHGNHGAAPPGLNSLAAVCGTCHAIEASVFGGSVHQSAFEKNNYPMCETCHSNHKILKPSDRMVGTSEPAVCVRCHKSDDGTKAFETADGMAAALRSLVSARYEARKKLDEAIRKGMMTTDEEFRIKEVDQALIQTRTMVHSAVLDSVVSRSEAGVRKADEVNENSVALIDEYYLRRKGLGLATLFITALAVALYLKIKRVDNSPKP